MCKIYNQTNSLKNLNKLLNILLCVMHKRAPAEPRRSEAPRDFLPSDVLVLLAYLDGNAFEAHLRGALRQIRGERGARAGQNVFEYLALYLPFGEEGVEFAVEEAVLQRNAALKRYRARRRSDRARYFGKLRHRAACGFSVGRRRSADAYAPCRSEPREFVRQPF